MQIVSLAMEKRRKKNVKMSFGGLYLVYRAFKDTNTLSRVAWFVLHFNNFK